MRYVIVAALLLLSATAAFGQAPPQEDQRLTVYRQLLSEANDRLAAAIAKANDLQADINKRDADAKKNEKP